MSENPQKKAVIYCRVSSTRQATEGHGLDSQESRCRDYAISRDYEVVAVFTDDVSGGGDFMKRPGMVRLLNYLDEHSKYEHIVIFDDLKRYARDTVFHLKLRQEMASRNATRECLNFKFEDTPEGEFIETIIAAQGQLERQQNSRQVRQKMKARILDGYYCFPAPMGYKYEKIKDHGKMLVRDEPVASIIAEGLNGFASGRFETQAELMRFFDSFPDFPRSREGKIYIQRIREILSRISYAGYVELPDWNIAPRPAKHEALISLMVYQKIQDRLNQKARAPARKDLNLSFPLRGAVVCGDCGTSLTSGMSKGRNGYHPYYFCRRKGCASYGKSIRRAQIEKEFENLLSKIQPSLAVIKTARKMFRMAWDYRQQNSSALIASANKEYAEFEKSIEQLIDRMMESKSSAVISACEKRIESLEKRKLLLKEKTEQAGKPKHSFEDSFRTAFLILSNPLKIWLEGQFEVKRMLLRMVFTDNLVYVRNHGFRTAQTSLPFSLLGNICSNDSGMVDLNGSSSNQLFEVLESWETQCKHSKMGISFDSNDFCP